MHPDRNSEVVIRPSLRPEMFDVVRIHRNRSGEILSTHATKERAEHALRAITNPTTTISDWSEW